MNGQTSDQHTSSNLDDSRSNHNPSTSVTRDNAQYSGTNPLIPTNAYNFNQHTCSNLDDSRTNSNPSTSFNQRYAQYSGTILSIPTNAYNFNQHTGSNLDDSRTNSNPSTSVTWDHVQYSGTNPSIPTNGIGYCQTGSQFNGAHTDTPSDIANVIQGISSSTEMNSVVRTVQGSSLDLHFKATGENEVTLPPMNLCHDNLFPKSLKINKESNHFLYACHWQHKLSTGEVKDMNYLGFEKDIMTRFNKLNGFTLSQKVNSKI